MLKELKNLAPWQWDKKQGTLGQKTLAEFEKVGEEDECLWTSGALSRAALEGRAELAAVFSRRLIMCC